MIPNGELGYSIDIDSPMSALQINLSDIETSNGKKI